MSDANHEALRYQFQIHHVDYREMTDPESEATYYLVRDDLPAELVTQIGACGFGMISPRVNPRAETPRCIVVPDAAVGAVRDGQ